MKKQTKKIKVKKRDISETARAIKAIKDKELELDVYSNEPDDSPSDEDIDCLNLDDLEDY